MNGWTPGPWRLRPRTNVLLGADGSVVGSASICWESRPRDLADARLMAAAPELYEALEEAHALLAPAIHSAGTTSSERDRCMAWEQRRGSALIAIETVLAKARGDDQ